MLIVLCGSSFSGKSTLAEAISAERDAAVVSLDEINARRGLWGGDGIPVEEWITTHGIAREEVAALLSAGRDVVLDDTASLRSLRDGWRDLADALGVDHRLVHLDVDRETVRARRVANTAAPSRRDVTDAVLDEHLDGFEHPTSDEHPLVMRAQDAPADLFRRLEAPPAPGPGGRGSRMSARGIDDTRP